MKAGDIIKNPNTSAKTGLTTWEEIVITQEDVDKAEAKAKADEAKAKRDATLAELIKLDSLAPRYLEDFIAGDLTRIEETIAKKLELRAKL